MFEQLKKRWHEFAAVPPGRRFKAHFKRRQQQAGPSSVYKRTFTIGGGVLIMLAGVFFLPAPGPGILILLAGAALIAEESFTAARLLDWLDLRVRAWLRPIERLWQRWRERKNPPH